MFAKKVEESFSNRAVASVCSGRVCTASGSAVSVSVSKIGETTLQVRAGVRNAHISVAKNEVPWIEHSTFTMIECIHGNVHVCSDSYCTLAVANDANTAYVCPMTKAQIYELWSSVESRYLKYAVARSPTCHGFFNAHYCNTNVIQEFAVVVQCAPNHVQFVKFGEELLRLPPSTSTLRVFLCEHGAVHFCGKGVCTIGYSNDTHEGECVCRISGLVLGAQLRDHNEWLGEYMSNLRDITHENASQRALRKHVNLELKRRKILQMSTVIENDAAYVVRCSPYTGVDPHICLYGHLDVLDVTTACIRQRMMMILFMGTFDLKIIAKVCHGIKARIEHEVHTKASAARLKSSWVIVVNLFSSLTKLTLKLPSKVSIPPVEVINAEFSRLADMCAALWQHLVRSGVITDDVFADAFCLACADLWRTGHFTEHRDFPVMGFSWLPDSFVMRHFDTHLLLHAEPLLLHSFNHYRVMLYGAVTDPSFFSTHTYSMAGELTPKHQKWRDAPSASAELRSAYSSP